MEKRFLLVIILLYLTFQVANGQTTNQRIKYLLDNFNSIIQRNDSVEIGNILIELSKIEVELCKNGRGCPNHIIPYLVGRLKCSLNDYNGVKNLTECKEYFYNAGNTNFIAEVDNDISNCLGTTRAAPSKGPKVRKVFFPNTGGSTARSRGSFKVNEPNSSEFNKIKKTLFDTTLQLINVDSFINRTFNHDELNKARNYYTEILEKSSLKETLASTHSSHFLIFHGKKDNVTKMISQLEKNLELWSTEYNLEVPSQYITIFYIPPSELSRSEKKKYRWQFSPEVNLRKKKYEPQVQQQIQTQLVTVRLGRRSTAPAYLFKKEFIQFAYFKDRIQLNEGDVGYNNPFDLTITSYSRNAIGAINHELFHILFYHNYPFSVAWLNEGLACLYEAFEIGDLNQLNPINNFRITQLNFPYSLSKVLCSDWKEIYSDDKIFENLALSRYICFYLQKNGQLNKFVNAVLSKSLASKLDNDDVLNLLLQCSQRSSLSDFEEDLGKFISEQKALVLKNGKLRKKYSAGLYKRKKFK